MLLIHVLRDVINSHHQVLFTCFSPLFQSLRSCVSEVIQAIDNQLFKHEDLQKKKVWPLVFLCDFNSIQFLFMKPRITFHIAQNRLNHNKIIQ